MELLTMTETELERSRTLQRVCDGYLSQIDAAVRLEISTRQVRRLMASFRKDGAAAIVSNRRGKPPNNRVGDELRATILELYRGVYHGFGPTLFAQSLAEQHSINVSREWLRALLADAGLWKRKRRQRNVHPLRARRPRFGELIQMDGSPHDWFEERGPKCTLLLAIDDATSRVTAGRFDKAETTDGYFLLLQNHVETFGRFRAAYTDKHSIFRYSGSSTDETIVTQIQRALEDLQIDLICANSPQAKGRIERANRTFQDRLVKMMRLNKINTIADANHFLPDFIRRHNERFAIKPLLGEDAHRTTAGYDIPHILCRHEERTVTKNLMFQIGDYFFTLVDAYSKRNLTTGSRLSIHVHPGGTMTVHHGNHELEVQPMGKRERIVPIVGSKDLNSHLDRRISDPTKTRTPDRNHPWKAYRDRLI